ncbi:hypothetical protein ACFXQA_14610 [Microbacterium sp. P07]|uniref:hypothetical protein n=1 Tax=Microbacterium sp. P07 TaxID=3366952 RepID=UPI0037453CCE
MSKSLIRRAGLGLAATVAVAGLAFGAALPANAEPLGSPTYRSLAGAGSDTTQDVLNGLSQSLTISGTKVIGSYNATGSATIKTKSTGATFQRPNGSTEGVRALSAALQGTSYPATGGTTLSSTDLQFARSSSGVSSSLASTTGPLQYIPMGIDAVTYATSPTTGSTPTRVPNGIIVGTTTSPTGTFAAPAPLTLRNIYNGGFVQVDPAVSTSQKFYAGTAYADQAALDAAFPPANTVIKLYPYLPQAGSGTRSFWATTVGINNTTPPAHVSSTFVDGTGVTRDVQEHNGQVVSPGTGANRNPVARNAIVPFSISQFIAQGRAAALTTKYGVTVTNRRVSAELRNIGAELPIEDGALNPDFPVRRSVYNVVANSAITGANSGSQLAQVFVGSTGLAYNQTTAPDGSDADTAPDATITGNVITDYGFAINPTAGLVDNSLRSNYVP